MGFADPITKRIKYPEFNFGYYFYNEYFENWLKSENFTTDDLFNNATKYHLFIQIPKFELTKDYVSKEASEKFSSLGRFIIAKEIVVSFLNHIILNETEEESIKESIIKFTLLPPKATKDITRLNEMIEYLKDKYPNEFNENSVIQKIFYSDFKEMKENKLLSTFFAIAYSLISSMKFIKDVDLKVYICNIKNNDFFNYLLKVAVSVIGDDNLIDKMFSKKNYAFNEMIYTGIPIPTFKDNEKYDFFEVIGRYPNLMIGENVIFIKELTREMTKNVVFSQVLKREDLKFLLFNKFKLKNFS